MLSRKGINVIGRVYFCYKKKGGNVMACPIFTLPFISFFSWR